MPEGLAQTMSDQELVDLLAFLVDPQAAGEHRRPVPGDRPRSPRPNGTPALDPTAQGRPRREPARPRGPEALLAPARRQRRGPGRPGHPGRRRRRAKVVYALRPGRLAGRRRRPGSSSTPRPTSKAWLDGKPVDLSPARATSEPADGRRRRSPKGPSDLLIRVRRRPAAPATLVTTFVADQPRRVPADECSLVGKADRRRSEATDPRRTV